MNDIFKNEISQGAWKKSNRTSVTAAIFSYSLALYSDWYESRRHGEELLNILLSKLYYEISYAYL